MIDIKEAAKFDWQRKMKYKDISAKYGVAESTIKSWAARYWKPETKNKKKSQSKSKKKSQPETNENETSASVIPKSKGGAPYGNKNAVGNSGGGAPYGNKNHFKHGLYEKTYWDTLDETELLMVNDMDFDLEEQQIQEQIKLLTVRERRLLQHIKEYKEKSSGLTLDSVVRRQLDINGNIVKGDRQSQTETTTKTVSTFEVIMKFEAELTRIQAKKTKCIEALRRIRIEAEKLELLKLKMGVGDDDVLEKAKELLGGIKSAF